MMPPFILFNVFHPGRVVKGGFVNCNIDARQPGVLLEGRLKMAVLKAHAGLIKY
jgi:hypothetical protein